MRLRPCLRSEQVSDPYQLVPTLDQHWYDEGAGLERMRPVAAAVVHEDDRAGRRVRDDAGDLVARAPGRIAGVDRPEHRLEPSLSGNPCEPAAVLAERR